MQKKDRYKCRKRTDTDFQEEQFGAAPTVKSILKSILNAILNAILNSMFNSILNSIIRHKTLEKS